MYLVYGHFVSTNWSFVFFCVVSLVSVYLNSFFIYLAEHVSHYSESFNSLQVVVEVVSF